MDYEKSVELALCLGFEKISDDNAFKGCYFEKNGKKWIHDIDALMRHLDVELYQDLELLGYDLENYHSYESHSNEMAVQEMQNIYREISHCEGEAAYLSDGVWLLPDGTLEER